MGPQDPDMQTQSLTVGLGSPVPRGLSQSALQMNHQLDMKMEDDHTGHQSMDQGGLIGVGVGGSGSQVPWRNFEDARAFVRSFKMRDQKAWRIWSKSGARPHDIPSHPDSAYQDNGWLSWRDWLGTSQGRPPRATKQKWKSFHEARDYVRSLHLDNQKEWRKWSSLHRPCDIPSHPHTAYKTVGWLSWRDWLGTAEGSSPRKSRVLARKVKDAPPPAETEVLADEQQTEDEEGEGEGEGERQPSFVEVAMAASFTNVRCLPPSPDDAGAGGDGSPYQSHQLQEEEAQCWIDMPVAKKVDMDAAQEEQEEE